MYTWDTQGREAPVNHWGLPTIQDEAVRGRPKKLSDFNPPSHRLISLLPHGKPYQCTKSGTNRTLNSFYPQAIRLLNKTTK